ncbi:hypothetical protein C0Z22_11680 [Halobacteriovorax sp. DA5]|nr:hypothetical protein C0Z22_11680 [Halobacteriovorax sp. DA5]
MYFNILIIIFFLLAAFSRKRYTMIIYPISLTMLLLNFLGVSSTVLLYFLFIFLSLFILILSVIEYCFPTSEVRFKRFEYLPYFLFTTIILGVFSVNIYHLKSSGGLIGAINNFNVDTHVDWTILLKFSVLLVFIAFLSIVNLDGDKNA